jgi:hypothetical protein
MTAFLTLDLADILADKLGGGITVPVHVDADEFLESADDDWDHELDLDRLLADQRRAAVILSAADIRDRHPHLTDEQAWDVAGVVRDDLRDMLDDFVASVVDLNHPSAKSALEGRLFRLRHALDRRDEPDAKSLSGRLSGLLDLLRKVPDTTAGNPALEGVIAATLDDFEAEAGRIGGAA